MMDTTSNPYLFTGAVLLAGLSGIRERAALGWEDCQVFPHSLDEGGRVKYQLDKRMPSSLQEALESLKEDTAFQVLIPQGLLGSYIPVKEKDIEVFQTMTEEQRLLKFLEYF
jgi:glutamine synthetase